MSSQTECLSHVPVPVQISIPDLESFISNNNDRYSRFMRKYFNNPARKIQAMSQNSFEFNYKHNLSLVYVEIARRWNWDINEQNKILFRETVIDELERRMKVLWEQKKRDKMRLDKEEREMMMETREAREDREARNLIMINKINKQNQMNLVISRRHCIKSIM